MRLLGEIDGVLSERGRAWVFFETAASTAEIRDRVRDALGADDLDLLLLFGSGHAPDGLAVAYASLTDPTLSGEYARIVRLYRDHVVRLGIDRTRHLLLHAERTQRPRPYSVVLESPTLKGYDGAGIDALRGVLEVVALDDDALLQRAVRPAKGTWIVHEQSLDDPERRRLRARFDGGRGTDQELSDSAAILLEQLRDTATVAECVAVHAEAMDAKSTAEIEAVTREVLAFVRRGLVVGMLE
jgi:hypothetical protein